MTKKYTFKCEIRRPDHLIYMAPTLSTKKKLNPTEARWATTYQQRLTSNEFASLRKFRLALVDALSVSEKAGLGGLPSIRLYLEHMPRRGEISMNYLEQAIRETVPAKIEANVAAAKRAYELTSVIEGAG